MDVVYAIETLAAAWPDSARMLVTDLGPELTPGPRLR